MHQNAIIAMVTVVALTTIGLLYLYIRRLESKVQREVVIARAESQKRRMRQAAAALRGRSPGYREGSRVRQAGTGSSRATAQGKGKQRKMQQQLQEQIDARPERAESRKACGSPQLAQGGWGTGEADNVAVEQAQAQPQEQQQQQQQGQQGQDEWNNGGGTDQGQDTNETTNDGGTGRFQPVDEGWNQNRDNDGAQSTTAEVGQAGDTGNQAGGGGEWNSDTKNDNDGQAQENQGGWHSTDGMAQQETTTQEGTQSYW